MGLEVKDISFSYGKNSVLKDLSLDVDDSEIYALLGGSGSGKTTLLSIIAGFLEPSGGSIKLNGKDITRTRIEKRGVGVVFQDYALFPHMNVGSNIQYPMEVRGMSSRDRRKKMDDLLSLVGLEGYGKRYPSELSGGEKQRISLARTLASDPSLILLDEPMSALDASLRDSLRREIRRILKDSGIPTIHVTHDQMEAVSISDRLGLLDDGRIIEEGRPGDMFGHPRKIQTARFMGFRNVLEIQGREDDKLNTPIGPVPWKGNIPSYVAFRGDSVNFEGDGLEITGKIISRELKGNILALTVDVNGTDIELVASMDLMDNVERSITFNVPQRKIIPLR